VTSPRETLEFDELRRRLADPQLTIVDVLPRVSYEQRHLPGSLSLPTAEIEREADRLLPTKDKELAVYCSGPT
jgi:rhodanese-related sulfurtransferase